MDLIPMILLAPVMIAVAYFDLRFMRIPNVLTLITVSIFAVVVLVFPPDDLIVRLVIAAVVFAIGSIGFAFRLIGGGDVKILSALMLLIPTNGLGIFANIFSVSLIVGIFLILSLRRFPAIKRWGWKSLGGSNKFPMGLSISMAGLAFPLVVLVMQNRP